MSNKKLSQFNGLSNLTEATHYIPIFTGGVDNYYIGIANAGKALSVWNSSTTGVTAYAGGGQANAVLLSNRYNDVTTVATTNDSTKLPTATVGRTSTVKNSGANTLMIYPPVGEAFEGLAINAGKTISSGSIMDFHCFTTGVWSEATIIASGQNMANANLTLTANRSHALAGFTLGFTGGNLGFGTSSPTARVHVVGSDDLSGTYAAQIGGATTTGLRVDNSGRVSIGRNPGSTTTLVSQAYSSDTLLLALFNNAGTVKHVVGIDGKISNYQASPTNYFEQSDGLNGDMFWYLSNTNIGTSARQGIKIFGNHAADGGCVLEHYSTGYTAATFAGLSSVAGYNHINSFSTSGGYGTGALAIGGNPIIHYVNSAPTTTAITTRLDATGYRIGGTVGNTTNNTFTVVGNAFIGSADGTANASAIVEFSSTTKGVLMPRMTATQASAITGVNGLVLYVTDTNGTFTSVGFWGYENGAWIKL